MEGLLLGAELEVLPGRRPSTDFLPELCRLAGISGKGLRSTVGPSNR